VGAAIGEVGDGFDPVEVGHGDVEEDDVGQKFGAAGDGLGAGGGLADDPFTEQCVVGGDDDADGGGRGSVGVMAAPAPAGLR
jgi:hypothetical protein